MYRDQEAAPSLEPSIKDLVLCDSQLSTFLKDNPNDVVSIFKRSHILFLEDVTSKGGEALCVWSFILILVLQSPPSESVIMFLVVVLNCWAITPFLKIALI